MRIETRIYQQFYHDTKKIIFKLKKLLSINEKNIKSSTFCIENKKLNNFANPLLENYSQYVRSNTGPRVTGNF